MVKKKNAKLVSLAYSDSEAEDALSGSEDHSEDDETQSNKGGEEDGDKDLPIDSTPEVFFEDIYGDQQFTAEEFHQKLFNKEIEELRIPARSKRPCPAELESQIEYYDKKVKQGLDIIKSIQERKSLRNPSIYEKMISYCQINEMATNYPKANYDPEPFLKGENFYEELARQQREAIEKHDREKAKSSGNHQSSKSSDKKSKWDSVQSNSSNSSAALALALARVQNIVHTQKNLKR